MIHWTRQIKEVLNAQDSLQTSENAGPMEELDFWKNRCADLSGISEQLDKLGVKRITEILQIARSSYVNAFLKLSGEIKVPSCFIYTLHVAYYTNQGFHCITSIAFYSVSTDLVITKYIDTKRHAILLKLFKS